MKLKILEYYIILCLEKGIEPTWKELRKFQLNNR
ncbi:hypothetical protein QOZ91_003778 [Clostridium sardiniense]|nr:hypothetical protein [Clostridium sardiniense]